VNEDEVEKGQRDTQPPRSARHGHLRRLGSFA
jgi:hypothetical protein